MLDILAHRRLDSTWLVEDKGEPTRRTRRFLRCLECCIVVAGDEAVVVVSEEEKVPLGAQFIQPSTHKRSLDLFTHITSLPYTVGLVIEPFYWTCSVA